MPLRAVVTAGGTKEPIDDVRVLTNVSRGRFGVAIAAALLRVGVEVDLLGSEEALRVAKDELGAPSGLRPVPFRSTLDLQSALEAATTSPPDLLFMAAAVADYLPEPRAGKIRSDQDELVIRLTKAPKLIAALRQRCGQTSFLVGFKLLSRVPRAELVAAARKQAKANRLNLVVANDLAELEGDLHPVTLVTPEGGALRVEGLRDRVAEELIDVALRRRAVTWCRTVAATLPPAGAGRAEAEALLGWAQESGLLAGTDGNVTARDGTGMVVTPRGVDKAALSANDLLHIDVDVMAREVRVPANRKASIDAPVHAWLYSRMSSLAGMVHFHEVLGLEDAITTRAWPCGTLEAASEIEAALGAAALTRAWEGVPFLARLIDHGWLLGLEQGGAARLRREWDAARSGHDAHLASLGPSGAPPAGHTRRPILAGGHVVGLELRFPGGGASPWLLPDRRGAGLGARLNAALDARGEPVLVHEGCGVLRFYLRHGWRPVERRGALTRLEPPSRRADLQRGASACLVDPLAGKVLLGKRVAPPWAGTWSFPGGGLAAGESPQDAARRELREETGVELPLGLAPAFSETVHVGSDDGARAFAVTGFCFVLAGQPAPRSSAEMSAEWVALETALGLELTPGVKRVLQRVADALSA